MIPTIPGLASALLLIIATACAMLALAVVGQRAIRTNASRRDQLRKNRVRPLILKILDGQRYFELSKRDRSSLVSLAAEMASKVNGDGRTILTDWLIEQNFKRDCLNKMKSPFPLTRARALERFAPMAHLSPRSIEHMLNDRDLAVRSLTAQIAGRSGGAALAPALLRSIGAHRKIPASIISMAVLRSAPSTILDFGGTLADSDNNVRALAIDLAGQLNLTDARKAFEVGLASSNGAVRAASLRSIQRMGSPMSLPALERMQTQGPLEYSSRRAAIEELQGG
jgi:hypothetical protein